MHIDCHGLNYLAIKRARGIVQARFLGINDRTKWTVSVASQEAQEVAHHKASIKAAAFSSTPGLPVSKT